MCEFGSHPYSELRGRNSMNRTLVSGVVAFALIVGAGLAMSDTAEAGHCGGVRHCGGGICGGHHGLFRGGCGGGLFSRLRARHCCAPAPVCCEPAPCEPAPCCEPEPCCEPDPCCGRSHGCGLFGLFRRHHCSSSCCGSGCGSSGCGGCGSSGCGGSVVMSAAPVEAAAPESSSDAAPPAPDAP